MSDDTTRRGRRDDDPEATGPMWPLPDDDRADPADESTLYVGRSGDPRFDARRRAAPAGASRRAPDREPTSVLSSPGPTPGGAVDPTRVAPDGVRDWLDEPLPEQPPRPRPRAGRPRRRRSGPTWPRIVAPVVLLAAVIAVVTLSVHAGVLGGSHQGAGQPSASVSPAAVKKYVYYRVRKGDSMSAIANRYHITLSELLALNPRAAESTIVIGERIKVPNTR